MGTALALPLGQQLRHLPAKKQAVPSSQIECNIQYLRALIRRVETEWFELSSDERSALISFANDFVDPKLTAFEMCIFPFFLIHATASRIKAALQGEHQYLQYAKNIETHHSLLSELVNMILCRAEASHPGYNEAVAVAIDEAMAGSNASAMNAADFGRWLTNESDQALK